MSELSERVAAEHQKVFNAGPVFGASCTCGWHEPHNGTQKHVSHVAEVTEAAVRETIAADIANAVLPTHPNTGYRDGITRAARIARGET